MFQKVNFKSLLSFLNLFGTKTRTVDVKKNPLSSGKKYRQDVNIFQNKTVGHKSHDPCFHVFLIEARDMIFVAHCTLYPRISSKLSVWIFHLCISHHGLTFHHNIIICDTRSRR